MTCKCEIEGGESCHAGEDCIVTERINSTQLTALLCLACNKIARWCGEGKNGCGTEECPAIHCDHCGMHYSLESKESSEAETFEQARKLMLSAYEA